MTAAAFKKIPHIQMTPTLQAAIEAAAGCKEVLCRNPGDPAEVRESLSRMARSFEDPAFFYADEAAGEAGAVKALILLATLHLEHINAGNHI
jgi:hypothetical protein